MEGGHKVGGSLGPTFMAGLPFAVPEILESKSFRVRKNFTKCSSDFTAIFSGTPKEKKTRGIAITSGFTRGVCKNRGFY